MPERDEPNPARVVADADVLAADLLLGGDAREALDHVRRHSWVELVASDPLLAQTERLVSKLADPALAADHRERLEAERVSVDQPGGPPALASAYRGEAAHLLVRRAPSIGESRAHAPAAGVRQRPSAGRVRPPLRSREPVRGRQERRVPGAGSGSSSVAAAVRLAKRPQYRERVRTN